MRGKDERSAVAGEASSRDGEELRIFSAARSAGAGARSHRLLGRMSYGCVDSNKYHKMLGALSVT